MAQTFAELQRDADERKLVRKIQKAVAVMARGDVELPTAQELFESGGGFKDLKADGWLPIGMVTTDGYQFGREVENEEVDALGYASAVREDITSVARSVTFTPLETGRKHLMELKYGVDLSGVEVDPDTGAFDFDEPDLPINSEYKLLILGADGPADEQWILGRGYGAVTLSEGGEESWGSEDPVGAEITLKILPDDDTGAPVRHYFGGTGVLKHHDAMGFDLASSGGGDDDGGDSGE